MPSAVTENSLRSFSGSANSSFDGPIRKSHEKTVGGVFAYTNGTDVETGLPDQRFDPVKNVKKITSSSNHNTNLNPLPNGTANGNSKVNGERAQSRIDGTSPGIAGTPKLMENGTKDGVASESSPMPSNAEKSSAETNRETMLQHSRPVDFSKLRATSHQGSYSSYEPQSPHRANTGNTIVESPTGMDSLSPQTTHLSGLNRFSSPPGMSPGASVQDRRATGSMEPPRLVHRHTLQIPKVTSSRASRDFSFSYGPSEEAISATGRFSPTHPDTTRHRRTSLGLVRKTTRSLQSDIHHDEPVPDEDAIRWTEAIRQKRASRRKRREEEEDDDRVIVGKKVDEGHVNWVTAYNMLTGIRFTVSRTNAKIDRELTDADFTARHKFSFDITGNELTPSAKYDFKFKDYSPWVFRHLRAIFNLDPADYLMSLTSKYILSELGSPGKSGSFFYFSRDYKYIIKTIHHAEHKLLRKILRDYYKHVVENPNTLISQFYGLHRVKIPYGRKIHFVVMNNLFPPHRDVHHMFDLKGSTVGRDFKEEDLETNPRATLKDLNWLRRDLHLEFDERIKRIFVEQMQKDVALLQRLHIMDYSLLVGIHDLEKGNEENLRENTLRVFQPGGERDEDHPGRNFLLRTPSRLENMRKARELRLTLKKERPVPMGLVSAKMPDEMAHEDERRDRIFYKDDGGIRATHEDGRGGEEIYYLGIIDCLTHYGFVKRIENFWKGLQSSRTQISPIPPEAYGDRFINFITGITMTKEEAARRAQERLNTPNRPHQLSLESSHSHSHPPPPRSPLSPIASVSTPRAQSQPQSQTQLQSQSQSQPPDLPAFISASTSPPQSPSQASVDRTMRKAQKQVDKSTNSEKGRQQSEEELPERTLGTLDGKNSITLPIVEEAGENGNIIGLKGTGATKPRTGIRKVDPEEYDDVGETIEEKKVQPAPQSTHFQEKDPLSTNIDGVPIEGGRRGGGGGPTEFDEKTSFPSLDQYQHQHQQQQQQPSQKLFSSPRTLEPSKSIVDSTTGKPVDQVNLPQAALDSVPGSTGVGISSSGVRGIRRGVARHTT